MAYDESVIDLIRETLMLVLKVSTPMLLAGIGIGLLVSLFQTVTSIQEQTLTFAPKIVVMVIVAIVLAPWVFSNLVSFAAEMFVLQ